MYVQPPCVYAWTRRSTANEALHFLDLSRNGIGASGAADVLELLTQHNDSLVRVNLCSNAIPEAAARNIGRLAGLRAQCDFQKAWLGPAASTADGGGAGGAAMDM